ncbi:MAG: glutathione S-transferase N-terminal domain-containing protein [Peptoniphilus sp.]|nr:glutathione S-transferase N-terminal domain-containing protein [Peptoniphilus sp.]
MKNLDLFYFPECPFCQKVLIFIDKNKIEGIELRNINKDAASEKELIELGGKRQVPALKIDGEIMYESDDIIKYLSENK